MAAQESAPTSHGLEGMQWMHACLGEAEAGAHQTDVNAMGQCVVCSAQALAESYSDADELAKEAYNLYSEFRPQIQTGQSGWGQKGLLDLQHIKQLHKK